MKSKSITLLTATMLGSLSQFAPASSDVDSLRQRCAEQERQIKVLEKEVDSLNSLLAVKGMAPKAPAAKASNSSTYIVRSGDSMSKIARNNSVNLDALMKANSGQDPRKLRVGQTLNLPGKVNTTAAAGKEENPAPAPRPVASQSGSYTIQKGDTLFSIARKRNTTVQRIQASNAGLDPARLVVGKRITIPAAGSAVAKQTSTPAAKAPQPRAVAKQAPQPKPQPKPQAQPTPQPKPQPAVAKAAPAPQPQAQVKQVSHQPAQPKIRTVTVGQQMTFGAFASQHGADIAQINQLNGLNLTKSTVLAQGSELYVPGNQN